MKIFIVGIYNGFDVDDYYVNARDEHYAIKQALSLAGYGEVYTVLTM